MNRKKQPAIEEAHYFTNAEEREEFLRRQRKTALLENPENSGSIVVPRPLQVNRETEPETSQPHIDFQEYEEEYGEEFENRIRDLLGEDYPEDPRDNI